MLEGIPELPIMKYAVDDENDENANIWKQMPPVGTRRFVIGLHNGEGFSNFYKGPLMNKLQATNPSNWVELGVSKPEVSEVSAKVNIPLEENQAEIEHL